MKYLWQKLHKISDILHLPSLPNWVCVLLFVVFLLRIPSFFEPYSYGDEMIYLNLGEGVRQGQVLYKEVFDNKPPLIYLTAAVAGSLFWFKAILAFWNITTIIIFWKLVSSLFEKNERLQKISIVVFALLTTLPILEGNTVNAELLMIGPSLIAFLLLLGKNLTPKKVFISGILFGTAALFKIPAAFDVPIIITYWVITKELKNWKQTLRDVVILGFGFSFPILLSFAAYFFQGALSEYIKAAFAQNVGYLESFGVKIPMIYRFLTVALGSLVVFLARKRLSKNFILVCLWTLFSLFAVTLSERPYPHYLVQSVAPLSLLIGMLVAQKTIEQSLSVIPLTLIVFVPLFYRFYYYPTATYYLRFIKFATGNISKEAYLQSYSSTANRNYKIAEFLANSSLRSERVLVWDPDSPIIYALSRRLPPSKFVVPYHVNDYSNRVEFAQQMTEAKPKFIVTTSNMPFPEISGLLKSNYLMISQIENAEIWSRISN